MQNYLFVKPILRDFSAPTLKFQLLLNQFFPTLIVCLFQNKAIGKDLTTLIIWINILSISFETNRLQDIPKAQGGLFWEKSIV